MNLVCSIILLSMVIVTNFDNALSRLTINNKEVHVPSSSANPTKTSKTYSNNSSSKGYALIGNTVWIDGKLIYTIPPNKSRYINPPYLMVDNRRVVNLRTGEILVPEAELNGSKTEEKATKSKIIGEIPYARPDTVVEASNGQIKIDDKVILEDEDFKNRGKVEFYVRNGKMYFNGNLILRDDPKGTFKMLGDITQITDSGMYDFTVQFVQGYTVIFH